MAYSKTRFALGLALSLGAISCGSEIPGAEGSDSNASCEEEQGCTCPDGSAGVLTCTGARVPVCYCDSEPAQAPGDEDITGAQRDAGALPAAPKPQPRDAGSAARDLDATIPRDPFRPRDGAAPAVRDAAAPAVRDAGLRPPVSDPGTDGTFAQAPRIPAAPENCPEIKTGTVTVLGQQVQLWVGQKRAGKKGPIVFYWHGTGSSATEARTGLGSGFQEIQEQGGVIASFTTTTRAGQNTGNNVWYTGDFAMADQILACAVAQQDVDPRRVYTAGCSAGGLQASAMVYGRSSYLAAAMPNSGGTIARYSLEDPTHVPAVIATHGAAGRDVVVIDFAKTTATLSKDLAAKQGFVVVCDHGGGHCGSPASVKDAQWNFLQAHPFGVTPPPYAGGLPDTFPGVCKIVAR